MKKHLIDTINNSENYTLAVAEAMPENGYSTKPADTVWNFGELMNHIAYGIEWWANNYIRKQEMPWEPPAPKKTKKETIAYLGDAYKYLRASFNGTASEDQVNGLHATLDLITHHRGQATTYLRFKGITPPDYAY
jgi:uncharacterized damage-inducible protein DinB